MTIDKFFPGQLKDPNFHFTKVKPKSKHPIGLDWTNIVYDYKEIIEWYEKGNNYGVLGGWGDLLPIDADTPEIEALVEKMLPDTFSVKTPKKGKHYYFYCPGVSNKVLLKKDGKQYGEIFAKTCQVLGPGSIHPETLTKYEVWNNVPIATITKELLIEVFKDYIFTAPEKHASANKDDVVLDIMKVVSSVCKMTKRGKQYFGAHPEHGSTSGENFVVDPEKNLWHCFRCGSGGNVISLVAVVEGIIKCEKAVPGGLKGEDFLKTVEIAKKRYGVIIPKQENISLRYTDQWNAWLFNKHTNGMFKFCRNNGLWYHFKDKYFIPNSFQDAYSSMRTTMLNIMDKEIEDVKNADEKIIKAVTTYKKASLGHMKIHHCLNAAKSFPKVELESTDFDADPFLINCLNGTLNLKTMKRVDHNPEHLITKISRANYNPEAACPNFEKFLDTIFEGKKHIINYVKRCLGYALCGNVSEQAFFILYGVGQNGKSTLMETVEHVLGDYAGSIEASALLEKSSDSNAALSERASLVGKRFVSTNEPKDDGEFDMSFIKKLTSMGDIGAKFMRQDVFYYKPTAKLFLSTNHKPNIRDTDKGTWRRIHYWPFLFTFDDCDKITDYATKYLFPETDGIFNLLVKGYAQYQSDGLAAPLDITSARDDYRRSENSYQQFIDEKCVIGPDKDIIKKDLFKAYQRYILPQKVRLSEFTEEIAKLGFLGKKATSGPNTDHHVFDGIELLPVWEPKNEY